MSEENNKTPEQIAKERLDRYMANPENFIEASREPGCKTNELILGASIKDGNMMSFISGSYQEVALAYMNLNYQVITYCNKQQMEAMKQATLANKIHIPGVNKKTKRFNA